MSSILAQIDTATGDLPTLMTLFNYSPIINGMIAILSVIALLLFLYQLLTLNLGQLAPATFIDDITKLVLARQYKDAVTLCRSRPNILAASIIQRCVENAGKEQSVIMEMLDSEGRRRADIVWNRVSYLADVSNIAPMFGLLGTVVGMIKAFFLLPSQSGSIASNVLAQGIGEAMATTMFGLIVGIMALMFYTIIKSRVTRALAEVEQLSHSIADHIKRDSEWAPPHNPSQNPRKKPGYQKSPVIDQDDNPTLLAQAELDDDQHNAGHSNEAGRA